MDSPAANSLAQVGPTQHPCIHRDDSPARSAPPPSPGSTNINAPRSYQPRRLLAVWFADIVGYSRMASTNEDGALRLIDRFHSSVREMVEQHGGRVVKFVGDAALAEFSSTEAAALSALLLVGAFEGQDDTQLRVGLHVGDVVRQDDGDLMGDGVNLAARLQAEAEPGEVLVSEDAWRQLRHREVYRFRESRPRRLKGQQEPVRVFVLLPELNVAGERTVGDLGGSARSDAGSASSPSLFNRIRARLLPAGGRSGAWRSPWVGIAAAGMVVLALLTGVFGGGRGRTWLSGLTGPAESSPSAMIAVADAPGEFDPARLAVLYFDDHSRGQQLDYLADGLTEALIHELTQIPALDVISRNGVKPFQDGDTQLDSIARALQVGTIVEGSVAQAGDHVRLTVQLIDGVTLSHLDSRELLLPAADLIAMRDSLVTEVADLLRRALGREIRVRQMRRGTTNREAYELVLRAQALRSDFTSLRMEAEAAARRVLVRADSLLVRAEVLDPRWAEPVLLRGWYARELSLMDGPIPGQLDTLWSERALNHANRAIALEAVGGYELLGVLRYELSRGAQGEARRRLREEAEGDLQHAVAMDDQRALAWLTLSDLYVSEARFPEAVLAAERSLEADAFLRNAATVLRQIYLASIVLGPTEEAKRACAEGRRRFPRSDDFVLCGLFVLASYPQVAPDVDHAWALADSLTAVVPRQDRDMFRAYGVMLVAQVAARAGLADSARAIIRLVADDRLRATFAYNEAHARLLMGEDEEAVRLLAFDLAASADTAALAKDWWFEDLRDNPDFRRLLGRFAESQSGTGGHPD